MHLSIRPSPYYSPLLSLLLLLVGPTKAYHRIGGLSERPKEVFTTGFEVNAPEASEPMYYVPQKPRIVQPLKSEIVISELPVLFVCMVEGNPLPRFQWTVSGIPVLTSPQLGEVITIPRGSVLRIARALPTLHGAFVACIAENALGRAEASARLFVYPNEDAAPPGFPRFLNVFSVIVAKKNDDVELECRTQGDPLPLIRWFKDSNPIDLTIVRFLVTAAGSLKIARLTEDDEGNYECTATNIHGTRISPGESLMVREDIEEALQTIALKAERFRPHFTLVPASQQVALPGGQMTLTCIAVGAPVPTVAWFEGGRRILHNVLDRQPPGTARLVLTNLTESRNVSCVAKSAMGQAEYTITVLVKELPPAPGELEVGEQPRPGEINLVFKKSTAYSNESSAASATFEVVAFVVFWIESSQFLPEYLDSHFPEAAIALKPIISKEAFQSSHPPGSLETTVAEINNQVSLRFRVIATAETKKSESNVRLQLNGLKPDTKYTVWCRSVGKNCDFSPSTRPVQFVTDQEAPSSAPLHIQTTAISSTEISVSWEEPLQKNGPITMYRIYYTNDPKAPLDQWSIKAMKMESDFSTKLQTLVTHLQPNATYYIRVAAFNVKGSGPLSSLFAVIVRPGALPAPLNFKAFSKSAHEVSLHWNTPDSKQRDFHLVNYELHVTPLDLEGNLDVATQKIYIEPSLNSYLINDLLPNTKYLMSLAAVSETGAGIQTQTTTKTKKYAPGPPNHVNVEATGFDRLRITWAPPKDSIPASLFAHVGKRAEELRIVYYDIDIRPTDIKEAWLSESNYGALDQQKSIRQQTTSESEIEEARGKLTYSKEVMGLLPDTPYVVHIQAVSRSGSGDRAKSNPTMTWPLPPSRPSALKLQTVVSPASRQHILRAHWRPPQQKKVPIRGFTYRIQWQLLVESEADESSEGISQNLKPISIQKATELDIAEDQLGGEENVTTLSWESSAGSLLGGLTYEVRVATVDAYQTGEDAIGRIEFPDSAPSLPPSDVRLDTTSPHLFLQWKAPPLKSRNGRLVTYEAECSWFDGTPNFGETWHTKFVKIAPINATPFVLYWPPGQISMLGFLTSADTSFKTVLRGRVRAWTSAGEGPWSKLEMLSLKNLVPKEPTSVNAIQLGRNGVLVTWAMPEGLIQTSYLIESAKSKTTEAGLPIYRQFVVEYAKQADITQPIQWKSSKTLGPQTSITLPIFENDDQHIVRAQSFGIANLQSNFSTPILVQKILQPRAQVVENLKCKAVDKDGSNAELELSWNLVGLPSTLRIIHYLVNYTGGRVHLNEDGDLIRESQGEREQSLRYSGAFIDTVVHRLVGLNFNTAYQVDVLPVIERSTTPMIVGETESVFCRTLSKPPQFVPTPEFHTSQNGEPAFILAYRSNEQNGTVATYEILAKEAGLIGEDENPAVLVRFPAVKLFSPLTKVVRIILNGSTNANTVREYGIFYAPSLMPGQAYDIALRACVESNIAIETDIGIFGNEGLSAVSLCSKSDWSSPEARKSNPSRKKTSTSQAQFTHNRDDPLWPAIVKESISSSTTSMQTPYNDAATVPHLEDRQSSSPKIYFPFADGMNPVIQPALPILATSTAGSTHNDRIQIIVAALSILIGICILGFFCFLIVRHIHRRGFHPHSQRSRQERKFDQNCIPTKMPNASPMKSNFKGIASAASVTASLPRYEPTMSKQGLLPSDGLSFYSELAGTASLGRFGKAAMMSMDGNCICSTPSAATETAASFEILSMALNTRLAPPPYNMDSPPSLIPGISDDEAASQPVALGDLVSHVKHLKHNQCLALSAAFESIDPGGQFTWEHSSRNANRPKNRYTNVVTYDHSRVVLAALDGDPDSDYINANYLDGYNRKRAYIATQGPLPNTVCDFWRMVWEQRSSTIVAMTQLEERERVKCEQYWPSSGLPTGSLDWLSSRQTMLVASESTQTIGSTSMSPIATTTYGQIIVSLMEVVELVYYTVRTFTIQKVGCREKRKIRQFQFTVWPDHGVPNHPAPLLMFLRRLNAEFVPNVGPVIVHCSAGVGRTGAYIVLDILLQQMHHENAVDVLAVVTKLRSQRNFVVQTKEQYAFIYEALVEAALSGNTELSACQLRSHWHKLIEPCCSTEKPITTPLVESDFDPLANTGLGLEFGQLVGQTVGPIAELIAHQSVGGLLTFAEDFTGPSLDALSGTLPVNLPKNRCGAAFVPYDSNRVKLSPIRGVDGSDYINASYVDSYRLRSAFIATQTPFIPYLDDFWRMIWETGSCIIVSLDSHEFNGESPYWPTGEIARYGFLVAEPLASYDMTAYVLREFRLTDAKIGQSRMIRLFQASHLSLLIKRALASCRPLNGSDVKDVTLPPSLPPLAEWLPTRSSANHTPTFEFIKSGNNYHRSASADGSKNSVFDEVACHKAAISLIDLIEQVYKTQGQFGLDGPITVHCRTGTGYLGIFIMLSILLERLRAEGVLDAFQTAKLLWWQRRGLVETSIEYAFCYATALEYLNLYEPLSVNQMNAQTPASPAL